MWENQYTETWIDNTATKVVLGMLLQLSNNGNNFLFEASGICLVGFAAWYWYYRPEEILKSNYLKLNNHTFS